MTDKRESASRDAGAAGESVIATIRIEAPTDGVGEFKCVVSAYPDCPTPHRIAILRAATDLMRELKGAERQGSYDEAAE